MVTEHLTGLEVVEAEMAFSQCGAQARTLDYSVVIKPPKVTSIRLESNY